MSKFTQKDREQLKEIRYGWPVLVVFFALGMSRFVIQDFFGRGWGFMTAVVAAALWFSLRPWRLGLLSDAARRNTRIVGTIFFCAHVLLAAQSYWRF
jgi:hypothetical protein